MTVLLFEDSHVEQLAPAVLARPAYAISCGGVRLADVVSQLGHPVWGVVRPYLSKLQQQDFPEFHIDCNEQIDCPLLINARLVPSIPKFEQLRSCLINGQPGAIWRDGQLVAAKLAMPIAKSDLDFDNFQQFLSQLATVDCAVLEAECELLHYPHDIVRHHLEIFAANLEYRISRGDYQEISDGVFTAVGATVGPHIVTNTQLGPIVLESDSVVSPFCSLTGPLLMAPRAVIAPQSIIKQSVSIGHRSKVGGEIQATIFEPNSNKQHHGYLGHSYIGGWVNLGAGTSNSNLKNTYGDVNIQVGQRSLPTGMTFFGCVIGDYTKAAINTAIFTGKLIGVGSMLYGHITENVGSFVNYARHLGDVTAADIEATIATQSRAFARREMVASNCDRQLLRDIFQRTQTDRQGLLNRPPRFSVHPSKDDSRISPDDPFDPTAEDPHAQRHD